MYCQIGNELVDCCRIGNGLVDWLWIGRLAMDWRWIGDGLADWQWIPRWSWIEIKLVDCRCIHRLVRDWQIGPGFALSWKIGAASASCVSVLVALTAWEIVPRRDTSVCPCSTLVPRLCAELFSD